MKKDVSHFAPHLRIETKELATTREVGAQPWVGNTHFVVENKGIDYTKKKLDDEIENEIGEIDSQHHLENDFNRSCKLEIASNNIASLVGPQKHSFVIAEIAYQRGC